MLSSNLEITLRNAYQLATDNKHEFVTLEHLLNSLTNDKDAISVLKACGVEIEELKKNLDDFIVDRDKNLNFFQKLFKKDRIKEASKSLEKEQQNQLKEQQKNSDNARRTRFLFYLLMLLLIVFAVVLVPFRDKVGMAFPFMETYLEYLIPMYDYIKGPLGLG